MAKKTVSGSRAAALNTAVVLPTGTGAGVVTEPSVVDVLKLGENQNDNAAGDAAAAEVARPVIAAGVVVEQASPGLGEHPALVGDQAGDAAVSEVTGPAIVPAVVVQPFTISTHTEEGSAADLAIPAAPLQAVTTETGPAPLPALEPAGSTNPDLVVFDLSQIPTSADRENLALVIAHVQAADRASLPNSPFDDDGEPRIRITSKIDGFRRGGIAHPATPVDHKISDFTEEQLDALWNEPNLTVLAL